MTARELKEYFKSSKEWDHARVPSKKTSYFSSDGLSVAYTDGYTTCRIYSYGMNKTFKVSLSGLYVDAEGNLRGWGGLEI